MRRELVITVNHDNDSEHARVSVCLAISIICLFNSPLNKHLMNSILYTRHDARCWGCQSSACDLAP